MMSEAIVFPKSAQKRLQELAEILTYRHPVPPDEVKIMWLHYLELSIRGVNWRAIWRVPKLQQKVLGIKSSHVLVEVKDVFCENFSFDVLIIKCMSGEMVEGKKSASFLDIFPTVDQEEANIGNVLYAAEALDHFRYFYEQIWTPLDEGMEVTDWPSVYLESRVQLQYDIECGNLSLRDVNRIRDLLQESARNQMRLREMEDADEEDEYGVPLLRIHRRQEQIRKELEELQNPVLRYLAAKEKEEHSSQTSTSETIIISPVGTFDVVQSFLQKVKNNVEPTEELRMCPSLQSAFLLESSFDRMLLPEGKHIVQGFAETNEFKLIRGLASPDSTILSSRNSGVMLSWCKNNLTLENITLDASDCFLVLRVLRGQVLTLKNCCVVGSGSYSSQGIVVCEGGKLHAEETEFRGLSVALELHALSDVTLKSCTICDCDVGVQMEEEAFLTIQKCSISGCKRYGIHKIVNDSCADEEMKLGSVDLITNEPGVCMEDTILKDNQEANVLIIQEPVVGLHDSICSGYGSYEHFHTSLVLSPSKTEDIVEEDFEDLGCRLMV